MRSTTTTFGFVAVPIEFTLVTIVLALDQVAIYMFLGRGAMFILAGARREQNFIYQLFKKGTEPIVKATRFITPRIILDKHIPFVAFLLLIWAGLMLVQAKRYLCVTYQLNCGPLTAATLTHRVVRV